MMYEAIVEERTIKTILVEADTDAQAAAKAYSEYVHVCKEIHPKERNIQVISLEKK